MLIAIKKKQNTQQMNAIYNTKKQEPLNTCRRGEGEGISSMVRGELTWLLLFSSVVEFLKKETLNTKPTKRMWTWSFSEAADTGGQADENSDGALGCYYFIC